MRLTSHLFSRLAGGRVRRPSTWRRSRSTATRIWAAASCSRCRSRSDRPSILRLAGHANIVRALRYTARDPDRPVRLAKAIELVTTQ